MQITKLIINSPSLYNEKVIKFEFSSIYVLQHSYISPAALDYPQGVLTEMSEAEVLNSMTRSHDSMMAVLKSRHRSLQIIYSLWQNKDLKVVIHLILRRNI